MEAPWLSISIFAIMLYYRLRYYIKQSLTSRTRNAALKNGVLVAYPRILGFYMIEKPIFPFKASLTIILAAQSLCHLQGVVSQKYALNDYPVSTNGLNDKVLKTMPPSGANTRGFFGNLAAKSKIFIL